MLIFAILIIFKNTQYYTQALHYVRKKLFKIITSVRQTHGMEEKYNDCENVNFYIWSTNNIY